MGYFKDLGCPYYLFQVTTLKVGVNKIPTLAPEPAQRVVQREHAARKEVFLKNLNHQVVFSHKLRIKYFTGFVRLRQGGKVFLEL